MNQESPEKTPKAQAVRKHFREWIAKRTKHQVPEDCLETILVQSSRYTGRRFSIAGFSLIWRIEQSQIQLFGIDGDLLSCQTVEDFCMPEFGECDPAETLQ
ncbi:MAG: hypothetical protein LW720_19310 [Pirellula sp.]|nr:hypothetical protein [Pirellula sp.]